DALRGRKGQRFGRAALSVDSIASWLAIYQRKPAVLRHGKTRNRIIAAICRKQKPPIRRKDDAARALERIRRAFLTADRLERAGASASGGSARNLGDLAVRAATIMNDGVFDFICLRVQTATASIRHSHFSRHGSSLCHARFLCHIFLSPYVRNWIRWK